MDVVSQDRGAAMEQEQRERYARHISLTEIGESGQERLLSSRVLIVGAGGLGSPAAMYLAAAGVGTIGIVDDDEVDRTNLQRQIIHTTDSVGRKKTASAREKIVRLNQDVTVEEYSLRLTAENAKGIFEKYDLVLDATDNFESKFLINDACVELQKPFIHGAVQRFGGQLMTYVPGKGPCYRCIFEEPPEPGAVPSCKETGVIGGICGIIGSMQSVEAVKYLLGIGNLLTGQLLTVDALTMEIRRVPFPQRNENCRACGGGTVSDNPQKK